MTGATRLLFIPLTLGMALLGACSHFFSERTSLRDSHPQVLDDGPVQCTECHEDQDRGSLKPYGAFTHSPVFVRKHALYAAQDDRLCNACHAQAFCSDCHAHESEVKPSIKYGNRPDRELMHRGDYFSRHMIDGKVDPASCYKCHGRTNNKQCTQCHR